MENKFLSALQLQTSKKSKGSHLKLLSRIKKPLSKKTSSETSWKSNSQVSLKRKSTTNSKFIPSKVLTWLCIKIMAWACLLQTLKSWSKAPETTSFTLTIRYFWTCSNAEIMPPFCTLNQSPIWTNWNPNLWTWLECQASPTLSKSWTQDQHSSEFKASDHTSDGFPSMQKKAKAWATLITILAQSVTQAAYCNWQCNGTQSTQSDKPVLELPRSIMSWLLVRTLRPSKMRSTAKTITTRIFCTTITIPVLPLTDRKLNLTFPKHKSKKNTPKTKTFSSALSLKWP